ncbi:IS3 family transposase, partial [Streptomyces sp. NPDC002755]|uniref:IS3 family transposase n=1 Tax=Streptomyces sp. NPDC002884 TaxID=3154544 RepID=UPI003329AB95
IHGVRRGLVRQRSRGEPLDAHQTECIRGRTFTTRAEANLALFEYIDGFHNSRRIQERLGFLSPIEFEEKHYAEQATAEPTNLNTHQPLLTS